MPPPYSPLVAPSQTVGDEDSSSYGLREQNLRFILGLKLHNLREERRLSLVQLSKGCGLSVSYLNEIEKGKKYPKTDKLLSLARALGVTYDELVSADPGEKLRPIAAILTTRMMDDLPLEHYGISPPVLMEIMAAGPERLGALLAFLGKLATRFSFSVDDLLRAAVRDDLETANYHFPDLEDRAASLASEIGWQAGQAPILSQVRFSLQHDFGWEIDEQKLGEFPDLADVGAVPVFGGPKPRLFLNPALPDARRAFFVARELAATALGHYAKSRKQFAPAKEGFRQLQAIARASYLGGALLMPRKTIVGELRALFEAPEWSHNRLLELVEKLGGDAEVVFHRIAQILPDLGISRRYLRRSRMDDSGAAPIIERELRPGGLREVEGSGFPGRRSRSALVARLAAKPDALPSAGAAIERCTRTGTEFFVLAVAHKRPLHGDAPSVMSIGIELDAATRKAIASLDSAELRAEAEDAAAPSEPPAPPRSVARHSALAAFLSAVNR